MMTMNTSLVNLSPTVSMVHSLHNVNQNHRKKRKRIQANNDDNDNEYKPWQSFSNKKKETKTIKNKQKKKNVGLWQVMMEEEPVPTPLPARFEELACTHLYNVQPAVWFCDKLREISDTDKGLRRLFIPTEGSEERLTPALTEQEKGRLRQGVPVLGFDQNGKSWNLQLQYWPNVGMNVLQKDWVDLVNENHLMAGVDTVRLWLSRYSSHDQPPQENKLCSLIGWKKGTIVKNK